jgi:hypothetical protein
MKLVLRILFWVLLSSATAVCQLPSSNCDELLSSFSDCPYTTARIIPSPASDTPSNLSAVLLLEGEQPGSGGQIPSNEFISLPPKVEHENFHWGRALLESFTFLAIEQAYVVKDDYHWVKVENGVPFNHYWRDYKASLSTWIHSGWDDGDPFLYSYVGHPIQGALTEYIQIQNDPQGRDLEFSNSKAYWWSRFKAFWWSAAYSAQWNIGPLSELTVEKYGTVSIARRPWNHNGSFPCFEHCVTGVGQVDLVTTPVGGAVWVLTEDVLDKKINRPIEAATRNQFLIDFMRCALNPTRSGANVLHGKAPWYRASRDAQEIYFASHPVRYPSGDAGRGKK